MIGTALLLTVVVIDVAVSERLCEILRLELEPGRAKLVSGVARIRSKMEAVWPRFRYMI